LGIEVKLLSIVQDVKRLAGNFQHFGNGQAIGPSLSINVPANSGERRNLAQLNKDCRITDVSRMNNVVATAERLQGFRAEEAVSVGDDADNDLSLAGHS